MAPASATSTTTIDNDPSHYLTSSISSLSSQRTQTTWLAKTYRRASQYYLTRRLPEALDAIEPAVFPEIATNGQSAANNEESRGSAPVAQSSRGTRVKIWSFYLTLLNTIIELGPEEGKLAIGNARYKAISTKIKTGVIWEEVVRQGYRGIEGQVDGEVVANLATLLLTHMPDQRLNQEKMEAYLSATLHPTFDVAAHLEASQNGRPVPQRADSSAGTSTPRDLNTRIKLLELYTLFILPSNDQWDYARDFITMSELLDEERREAFLGALQQIREERSLDAVRETELRRRQEEEESQKLQRERDEQKRRERASEKFQAQPQDHRDAKKDTASQEQGVRSGKPSKAPRSSQTAGPGNSSSTDQRPTPSGRPNRPIRKKPPPTVTMYQRATLMLGSLRTSLSHISFDVQQNPMKALRYLLFLFAFIMAFARRDVRQRIKRMSDSLMLKLRQTVGMGMKVSYI